VSDCDLRTRTAHQRRRFADSPHPTDRLPCAEYRGRGPRCLGRGRTLRNASITVARFFGPVLSVVSGGIGTILVVLAIAAAWPEIRRLRKL